MIRSATERMNVAIDTVDSMTEDQLRIAMRQKLIQELNKDESIDIARDRAERKLNKSLHFIKSYRARGRELCVDKNLSIVDRGFLFTLQYWLAPGNGLLVDKNNIPLTKEKIMNMTMLKKTKFYEVVNKLKQMGIMKIIEDEGRVYYTLNPEFFEYLK